MRHHLWRWVLAAAVFTSLAVTSVGTPAFAVSSECEPGTTWMNYDIDPGEEFTYVAETYVGPNDSLTKDVAWNQMKSITAEVHFNMQTTVSGNAIIAGLESQTTWDLAANLTTTTTMESRYTYNFTGPGYWIVYVGAYTVESTFRQYRCDSWGNINYTGLSGDAKTWRMESDGKVRCEDPAPAWGLAKLAYAKCYGGAPFSPVLNPTYRWCRCIDLGSAPPSQPTNKVVYEAASDRGWQKMSVTGTSGHVQGSSVAALNVSGSKRVYTLNNGAVYEASSANTWANLNTGITGITGSAIATAAIGDTKYIYTIKNGTVYEASSANGWQNLNTGITGVSGTALAAISINGTKYIYTIKNGTVYEASSANSWINLNTGITGVSSTALAAIAVDGTKRIYTIKNGTVYEASSTNSWINLNTGAAGTKVAAISQGSLKTFYVL